jgi:rhamnosyltransferase
MIQSSILLLTKNGRHDLEHLLPALFAQRDVDTFEVIAVDSGSFDGTVDLLRAFPVRIEQISAATFHHARTRNLAASFARGRVLVFLSQDAIPSSELWLSALISSFDDPKVGAAYGRQRPKPGCSVERRDTLDALYGEQRIVKDPACRDGLGYRFYHFSDVNSAIRRSVWDALRFPEHMPVFEDLGIAKRILDSGWRIVYEPASCVFHSHTHTAAGLLKRYFDIGCSLKALKIWDEPDIKRTMIRDCRKLLGAKLSRLGQADSTSAGAGLMQDIAKSMGLFLGLNQGCLPTGLKRRLSAFQIFE